MLATTSAAPLPAGAETLLQRLLPRIGGGTPASSDPSVPPPLPPPPELSGTTAGTPATAAKPGTPTTGAAAAPAIAGTAGSAPSPAAKAGSSASGPLVVDPQSLTHPGYCPELRIPLDGEAYALYDPEHIGDARYVKYLASITQTARECLQVTDTGITLKIGVAGRTIAGPLGGLGKITLPIRVTVIKQTTNAVIYKKSFSAPVTVNRPDYSADFSQVIPEVAFKRSPLDEDLIVYVGFDHGDG